MVQLRKSLFGKRKVQEVVNRQKTWPLHNHVEGGHKELEETLSFLHNLPGRRRRSMHLKKGSPREGEGLIQGREKTTISVGFISMNLSVGRSGT